MSGLPPWICMSVKRSRPRFGPSPSHIYTHTHHITPHHPPHPEAEAEKTTMQIDDVKGQEPPNPIVKTNKEIEDENCQVLSTPIAKLEPVVEEHTVRNDEEKLPPERSHRPTMSTAER